MPENLKNVLLFMSSNGYLVPPAQDPSKERLWSESWKRIDRFLPDLRKELALDAEQDQQAKADMSASEVVSEPALAVSDAPVDASPAVEETTPEKAEGKVE